MTQQDNISSTRGRKGQLGRIGERSYGMLWFSIVIRAAHQLGAALFLTYYLLGRGGDLPGVYSAVVMVSGGLLVLTEWLRHRQLYREVAGVVTLAKCLVLGGVIHNVLPATVFVVIVFLLASLAAHAPKNVRHRLLW